MKMQSIIKPLCYVAFSICLFFGLSSFNGQKEALPGNPDPAQELWFDLDGNIGPYKVNTPRKESIPAHSTAISPHAVSTSPALSPMSGQGKNLSLN